MPSKINHSEPILESPKKRVLFIITQSELGGAQRFLHTLTTHLDKEGYQILVAAGPNFSIKNPVLSIKYDLLDLLETQGINTIRLKHLFRGINPWYDFRALLELRRLIKNRQPDTIFLSSSKAGFLGSLAARNIEISKYRNIKILYRIGGWSFNDPWPVWKKRLWIFLEKLSAKWKDIIIVNNKHDFDQAIDKKIVPRQKLHLIYNGLDVYKMNFLSKEEYLCRFGTMSFSSLFCFLRYSIKQ